MAGRLTSCASSGASTNSRHSDPCCARTSATRATWTFWSPLLPGRKPKLFGLVDFQEQFQTLLARRVDLAEPEQQKWVIRDRVLREARVVYAA